MIKNKFKDDAIKIIEKFGKEHQKNKAIEELAELVVALAKNDKTNIVEETADVLFMILQIQIVYDIKDETIDEIIKEKIERIRKKLCM